MSNAERVAQHWRVSVFMLERWPVLWRNVITACALEAMLRSGRRAGAMHVNAAAVSLAARLTRELDAVTDPFDSTEESRAAARVRWGL